MKDGYYKLSFTGDLMCYPCMWERTGSNFDCMLEKVNDLLHDADYLVGNLETPVAGEDLTLTHARYSFNTPESYLDTMKKAGFDMMTLATNHAIDRGYTGIERTIANLDKRGIEHIGAYTSKEDRDRPFVKDFGGARVSFVNYTYGINASQGNRVEKDYSLNLFQPDESNESCVMPHHADAEERFARLYKKENEYTPLLNGYLDRLRADIQNAKKASDYVIMLPHFGGQYNTTIDSYTYFLADKFKEYGADIIISHHPHVILPTVIENGYITVYSLGNFLYSPDVPGKMKDVDHTYSALYHLDIKKENGQIKTKSTFSVMKVQMNEKDIPIVWEASRLYEETKDETIRKDMLWHASRFANRKIDTVEAEYELK